MNITRPLRHLGTTLSLATAVLLGSCAQSPFQPEAGPTIIDEPPPAVSGAPGPAGPRVGPPLGPGLGLPAGQAPIALRPDHPQTYTVVPGDTLWSIASRFLKNPWQWRQIWRKNQQIRNPHRIYPGDVLRFSYDPAGNPQLEIGQREEVPLLKLVPEVRVESLVEPIPPVPRAAIESFLARGQILGAADWQKLPYILADDDDQAIYADRDRVYARGADFDQSRYQVFRVGEELREPGSGRSLGVSGVYLGEAVLERAEDPATFVLAKTIAPVRAGDRLVEIEEDKEVYSFEPHPVPPDTQGTIIARLNTDVTQITQYSSVVVNLGAQEGMEPGHVLAIFGKDRKVEDPVSGGSVRIPGERAGLLMIYKVHDLVSYGLVMQAERSIRMQDRVLTP
ncbi:putative Peptidoglycan-binding LysM [Candidatus Competibacter denitrificans Run_A_D11]|uniref:Peptidoglycan-binding LysM n=1 Tax=Candidatus Competibacter denitrificans Run_A_D11 TaxID=1400863 RepID=W6M0P4_9GAMM|nr:LysM peptidoglycan-binding domain-containing protein [Candidatus Competibacter denitrificans]CDI00926.1 putative Peptidoglycan-binding LysM [Candidatus Competibacter denitrificans Run_A_D11]HRC70049.1 LysM peptidoglycan-binding domain-containing protein [Candidatus Competibacter denitrificans]